MKYKQDLPFLLISFFFLTMLMSSSCVKDPPKLTRDHKAQIDTLVKQQSLIIRREVDSLCKIDFDKKVQEATDSIVKVRLEEINRQFR